MALRDARATFLAVVKGDTSQAVTEFRKFGDTVQKSTMTASAATGRWQQSLGSAKGAVGAFVTSGYGMATMAGAAAAAIGKSVMAASELALEVGRLTDATGLSTDAASRWVEVGGDLGMTADQLAGLIEKMTKNLGATPEKFQRLGISVQRAKDGAADMNATLLAAIGRLNDIEDPTERAALAQQLFGKSWADASELIAMSSEELAARLEDVDSSKIIDEGDIDDAREFRDALDDLVDQLEGLMVEVGQHVIPVLADLAKILSSVIGVVGDVDGAIRKATGGVLDIRYAIGGLAAGPLGIAAVGLWDLKDATQGAGFVTEFLAEVTADETAAAEAAAAAEKNRADVIAAATQAMADYREEISGLYRDVMGGADAQLDYNAAWQDYLASLQSYLTTADDPATFQNESAISLERASRAAMDTAAAFAVLEGHTADSKEGVEDQIEALSNMAAWLEPGSPLRAFLLGYIDDLKSIPTSKVTNLELRTTTVPVRGSDGSVSQVPYYIANPKNVVAPGRASGGVSGGRIWAGEFGPELIDVPAGSWVHNSSTSAQMVRRAASSGAGSGGATVVNIPVTVHATPGTDRARLGREMIDAINAAYASGTARLAA